MMHGTMNIKPIAVALRHISVVFIIHETKSASSDTLLPNFELANYSACLSKCPARSSGKRICVESCKLGGPEVYSSDHLFLNHFLLK